MEPKITIRKLAVLFLNPHLRLAALAFAAVVCSDQFCRGSNETIDFSRQVLPVLSDACFQCHGPDATGRQADLRFDDEASVKEDRGGYAVVTPGDADASELMQRLLTNDESMRMPPTSLNRKLTDEQIDWINQHPELIALIDRLASDYNSTFTDADGQ